MKWFLKCLKQYADFRGRARRKEYWMFVLFNGIFSLIAVLLDVVMGTTIGDVGVIEALYMLALIVPGLAVTVRRLHDTNQSAWWLILILFPVVGSIWLFVLTLNDSHPETNEWGPNPKAGAEEC